MTVQRDRILRGYAAGRVADALAFHQMDLCLDDVDAGDFLGHRVFDLHPRVDLDEVEGVGVHVHQELDGARPDVAGGIGDLQGMGRQFTALIVVEIGRRCALDDLLVAPLDGAVALEQVDRVAVGVTEDLHLDMAGALDELFQIHFILAEGGTRLAACLADIAQQIILAVDRPHAATATAPRRLEHHRIADLGGSPAHDLVIVRQRFTGRHHGNTCLFGDIARCHLVAQRAHRVGRRADEDHAGSFAGIDELRALRQ